MNEHVPKASSDVTEQLERAAAARYAADKAHQDRLLKALAVPRPYIAPDQWHSEMRRKEMWMEGLR